MRELIVAVCASALFSLFVTSVAGAAAKTVREPAFGLPHFYADTDPELARENGREIARDRLAQLILLSRVGRGTLYQAFGVLDPGTIGSDIEARRTGYTSSELNRMFSNLPERGRELVLEYCKGVNDTIEAIYAGELPEPFEVTLLRSVLLQLPDDLFGNKQDLSDGVDPFYVAPGVDEEYPNAGFQFTPEMAMSIAVLEVRNFGLGGFDEASRFDELQALIGDLGSQDGTAVWSDRNFSNDPLAPVSVPDPTTPGFGGPLAQKKESTVDSRLVAASRRFPRFDFAAAMSRVRARQEARAELATRLGAWPRLGSYAWVIGGGRSETGWPWVGGFPQTGVQTPSIMHFAENRSAEGIRGIGMEFAGAPFILIGQTDRVAFTTTTAQLPVLDTVFERIVMEDADALRYLDEGIPAPLSMRTEIIRGLPERLLVAWRSHERNGNGGSRPVVEFIGDAEGTVESGTLETLTDTGAFSSAFAGGYVALVDGTGAGQIREIEGATADALTVRNDWATAPDDTTAYVAVMGVSPPAAGGRGLALERSIIAVASDSLTWLEESTAAYGFSLYQEAQSLDDVRAATRLIPSTHNFFAADNQAFNQIGTRSGNGNIGYWSSGYARVRQSGVFAARGAGDTDMRLPVDGSLPSPFVVAAGAVVSATATTLVAAGGAFGPGALDAPAINARYEEPGQAISEYVVAITSGTGAKQTRRIASNDAATLTLESPWGVTPDATSTFEVQEIIGMPEAVNPSEGYTGNWNNKAATMDPGDGFGRQHRVNFILERLAANASWNREDQRALNADVAGLDGKGAFGRYLIPRLRQAVDAAGASADPTVVAMLEALEAHNGAPEFGRRFVDPVNDTHDAGEVVFLNRLVGRLADVIYGGELASIGVPGGSRALALVTHAIDSAAGDVPGSYEQAYAGDYFNGFGWPDLLYAVLAAEVQAGVPADGERPVRRYVHPLAALDESLVFPETPAGNRGVWEQIVEVGPVVKGEFIFPLGQSGHIEGQLAGGVSAIDRNFTTLHPIWRDWRFVPMLAVSADLASGGDGDGDADGVLDGFERWYFGDTSRDGNDDSDADALALVDEYLAGSDPTNEDTDGDAALDGKDFAPQDRLVVVPEPSGVACALAALLSLGAVGRGSGGRRTKRIE